MVDPVKRQSKYWSRRSPRLKSEEGGGCARVDPSGAERNMNDVSCEHRLSFICEFDDEPKECKGHTEEVVGQEPFQVPPLSYCQREGPLNTTKVVDFARAISPSTALCDMGSETGKDYKEMVSNFWQSDVLSEARNIQGDPESEGGFYVKLAIGRTKVRSELTGLHACLFSHNM
ncbi:hypothetical protein BSKO_09267 [Bryopsis sp. KO-2023]|nr:hypothetical protein BSKO_09267 [Bryopsis sp. KO-2023]